MPSIKVSTVHEVLEQFRRDIVAQLQAVGVQVPPEAHVPGNCDQALFAWVRIQHRAIPPIRRTVCESMELRQRTLGADIQASISAIRLEIERGDDVTHRLTRSFYRAGFNDFLFNTFGIQHLHLGACGVGRDKTRRHAMSGSDDALLFAAFGQKEAYFIEVLNHEVFNSAEMTKSLVQIALRNWPNSLKRYVLVGARGSSSFEEAFRGAKAGFGTLFEIDGVCFTRGTVLDGKVTNGIRAACTSTEVIDAADRILNMIIEVVRFVTREAETLAETVESQTGIRPNEFRLEVVQAGPSVVLRDQNTSMVFFDNGRNVGSLHVASRPEGAVVSKLQD